MNANNPIIVVGDAVAWPDIDRSDTDILLVAAERILGRLLLREIMLDEEAEREAARES